MIIHCSSGKIINWQINQKFPKVEAVYISADGKELQLIKEKCPTLPFSNADSNCWIFPFTELITSQLRQ